ncbi:MAG: hypothetical protein ACRC6T_04960 [Sarcina sp.]
MRKNYCGNCGKEIKLREVLIQSIMFGVYCEKCGEISRATKSSKLVFSGIFISVITLNIVSSLDWIFKIIISILWCLIALWFIQPIICKFE